MAWLFSMFINTENQINEMSENMFSYFKPVDCLIISNGAKTIEITTELTPTGLNIIVPLGISNPVYGDAKNMTDEIIQILVDQLKSGPDFNFAYIGIEVDDELTIEEFIKTYPTYLEVGVTGLYFSEKIYERIRKCHNTNLVIDQDSPVTFKPHYLCIPHNGKGY